MTGKIIVVGSVTYAIKAKDILFAHGIRAYTEKIKNSGSFGCGYALRVRSNAELAVKILEENRIKILSVIDSD